MVDQPKCAYCFSTEVEIVSSFQQRDAMVIRCRRCGRTSPVDTENPEVDLNDPSLHE